MPIKNCGNCRYYEEDIEDAVGHCRRYPPLPIGDTKANDATWLQPVVFVDDWCGEWNGMPQDPPERIE